VITLPLLLALLAPQEAPQAPAVFDAAVPAELRVMKAKTGHLLVRPIVNGHDAGWFIFDTGAGMSVVSTPHVQELGLTAAGEVHAVGVGGGEQAGVHRIAHLVLGPLTLQDQEVISTDLSFLEQHLGEEIVGVIGHGVLARCIAEIDLQAPRVALHDPQSWALSAGEWTPMSLEGNVPTVDALFEGRAGRFQLDTGSNSSVVFHAPAVRKWKLLEDRQLADCKLGGVGGFVAAKSGTLRSFTLGGQEQQDVEASFALEDKGNYAGDSTDGTIGCKVLSACVLVVDYGGGRIAFAKRP